MIDLFVDIPWWIRLFVYVANNFGYGGAADSNAGYGGGGGGGF